MAVEAMADHRLRQVVLRELRNELGDAFDPPASHTPGGGGWEIVSACIELGQMHMLVEALRVVGGQTQALSMLKALVDQMFAPRVLGPADRLALAELLGPVHPKVIAQALAAIGLSPLEVEQHPSGGVGAAALERLDAMAGRGQLETHHIWDFLESVAHQTDPPTSMELWQVCRRISDQSGDSVINAVTWEPEAALASGWEPQVSGLPSMIRGLPPRNPFFAGRDDLLEQLRSALRSDESAVLLPHALHGLGGVGKSQVAYEYAYRYSDSYDLIFLVDASEEQAIRRSFVSLGKALGVPESDDVEYTIDATLNELRIGRPYQRWLLVFDDAVEPAVVRRYLPVHSAGHVLITSRNREWAALSTFVPVDVFTPEESLEFLLRRWSELSEEQATQLAERLGHLPLALEIAASFHEQTGMRVDDYLSGYEQIVPLLDESAPSYPQSVAAVWRLAFEQLGRHSAAAQLLQLCAFISSAPIEISMLREGRGADLPSPLKETLLDEIRFRRAVGQLSRYALAQVDPMRDCINIHMLVRAVLRDSLDEQQRVRFERAAHEVLALANPGSPDRSSTWARHAQIAPHVVASGVVSSGEPHVRQVVIDQIRYFFALGDFPESRRLAEQAVQEWSGRLGHLDVMTLRARFHLANAVRALGDYDLAREHTAEIYQRALRVFGEDDESTLQIGNGFGTDLRLVGEFELARSHDEDLLARHLRVLGNQDSSTLRAATNLAADYRLLGRFGEAKALDQDTLAWRTGLEPGNPEILESVNGLVCDLYGLGHYAAGLALQLERLPEFETAILPPGHRILLAARRNLAVLWRKTGDTGRALKIAELEFEAAKLAAGPLHGATLAAMNTLCNTLRARGDLDAARDVGEEALEGYRRRFRRHPFTAAAAVNLSIVYRMRHRLDDACRLNREALAALRASLGEDHPYTMCAEANEANNLALLGEREPALALSSRVVERAWRMRSLDHPETLACVANLALDMDAMGEHAEADQLRNETFENMRSGLGPEHFETVNVERRRRAELDIEMPPL